jgi:hypothetical protein
MRIKVFKNNKKEIIFTENADFVKNTFANPKPGHNFIPKWFKDAKLFSNGKNDVISSIKDKDVFGTYKLCVPLTDTMSSGYIISLPATVYVINTGTKEKYEPFIKWSVPWNVCDTQPQDALNNYPVPYEHNSYFFRWLLNWHIETPPGYSLWITHPSHRYDLPFTTINGFVDTDRHPNSLLLPFFIRDGFEGIIEEGTPIAQIIPVKREHWISTKKPFNLNKQFSLDKVTIDFIRTYKKRYWSKKTYE